MEYINEILLIIVAFLLGLFIKQFLPSYMKEKGKNLATKEDIAEITKLTENVKADIQKDLESHKRSFDVEIEELKLKQNQLFTNFELYTTKRHECYPELYKLIEICNGSIRRLRGTQRVLTFENVNAQDIESFMQDKLFTSNDIELILSHWDTDKNNAIFLLHKRLQRLNYNEAEEKFIEANDYFYFMVLYLSEDVEYIARDLLKKLHGLWMNFDPDYPWDKILVNEKWLSNDEVIVQIDELRNNLKLKMRQELLPS
ncbi:hypothetical protein [Bacillus sp. 522_BSPC]|uniref:hypothetical protein n=1 Tax=Bacillus sp. 522_BSPC TaxID=1579338 RepID=UPI00065FFD57|nr:hypothetical protein [Bacillus sp. 522_BSPC]